ncbi:YciI family protein [Nesterenkonia ebinurensis]|uniref:YciI family protein n=1 Tax=Nesterenkonia ebinurensis TaxID=2608252 RepID=UPI00123D4500|nr:YciI family protein [Nesterenkonia ebinurensis]
MKHYMFLIAYQPGDLSAASEEARAAFFEQHGAFSAFVAEHGKELASAALDDVETATTVRHVNGEIVVSDGPFAQTSEIIGGYYQVELPDLDTAIAAVRLLPPSYSLEIRPISTIT